MLALAITAQCIVNAVFNAQCLHCTFGWFQCEW